MDASKVVKSFTKSRGGPTAKTNSIYDNTATNNSQYVRVIVPIEEFLIQVIIFIYFFFLFFFTFFTEGINYFISTLKKNHSQGTKFLNTIYASPDSMTRTILKTKMWNMYMKILNIA